MNGVYLLGTDDDLLVAPKAYGKPGDNDYSLIKMNINNEIVYYVNYKDNTYEEITFTKGEEYWTPSLSGSRIIGNLTGSLDIESIEANVTVSYSSALNRVYLDREDGTYIIYYIGIGHKKGPRREPFHVFIDSITD